MGKSCSFIDYPKVLMVKVLALSCFKPKDLIFMHCLGFLRIKVEALWFILDKGRNFMYYTRLSRLKMLTLW
jgi:hypothetical protein